MSGDDYSSSDPRAANSSLNKKKEARASVEKPGRHHSLSINVPKPPAPPPQRTVSKALLWGLFALPIILIIIGAITAGVYFQAPLRPWGTPGRSSGPPEDLLKPVDDLLAKLIKGERRVQRPGAYASY
jgi:hypothetical protein